MSRAVPRAKSPMNDIRWGLIWMALSAGIILRLTWITVRYVHHVSGIAAVPGLIGLVLFVLGIIGLNTRDKK
ncbi:MAG: hypothetical protein WDN06_18480 [Asticcacaulis sp.]